MPDDQSRCIADLQRQLRALDTTPEELVDRCLANIRRWESQVHAWVLVDEAGARRDAERLGTLLKQGQPIGPLHGIPIGIKDIVDVRGLPTEAGSKLLAGQIAEQDAEVVQRLRAAGAILLGKTVTTEFACFDPSPTRNPWNLQHTPGGSSSGSAAAVSLEMCQAAIGSQTGGSITRPAAYCGIAGMKPSYGRIDTTGVVPVSWRLDHVGPLAGNVADLAVLFSVMDSRGESIVSEPLDAPPPLVRFDQFFLEQADSEVVEVTIAAYARLNAAGAGLAALELPATFPQCLAMQRTIMAVDAAETHCTTFTQNQEAYGPLISALLEEGLSTFAIDYALALRHQPKFCRDMAELLQGGRIAVMPSTPTVAPAGLESTGDPRFNSPWSYAGLPTVTIPCGLSAAGLPCGLQLVGGPQQDHALLAAAAWCEQVLQFSDRPACMGAGG